MVDTIQGIGLILIYVGLVLYMIGVTDEMFTDPPEEERLPDTSMPPGVPRIPTKETR